MSETDKALEAATAAMWDDAHPGFPWTTMLEVNKNLAPIQEACRRRMRIALAAYAAKSDAAQFRLHEENASWQRVHRAEYEKREALDAEAAKLRGLLHRAMNTGIFPMGVHDELRAALSPSCGNESMGEK